ncbi:PREDICTED: myelin-oligodendrocyte glycoprotein [Myotis brandtii]|uniref:myelin-oligodendrocyte glycoprotein n=1 Tax=Myotis brandtii TaxID=109478 RepID=UPI0007045C1A|nr:PREDICTED: myelin-oligodendrocyte glycoprotein [Myotis brandtii]
MASFWSSSLPSRLPFFLLLLQSPSSHADRVRFSDEGGFTCFFRDHGQQEEAALELKVEDPFHWVGPSALAGLAVLPLLLLQLVAGLLFLGLQRRLRGKLRAEIESLHRTFDPHFLRVPCWKVTLFVIVPVLGPLAALVICYNWLHRRLAGQFLEELSKFFPPSYKLKTKKQKSSKRVGP